MKVYVLEEYYGNSSWTIVGIYRTGEAAYLALDSAVVGSGAYGILKFQYTR